MIAYYKITYYDEITACGSCQGILYANTFVEAVKQLEKYYGDGMLEINELRLIDYGMAELPSDLYEQVKNSFLEKEGL